MKRIIVPLVVFVLMSFPGALAADGDKSYLCIAEQSTGFIFDESTKAWRQTIFSVDEEKFIIRPVRPDDLDVDDDSGKWANVVMLEGASYGIWKIGKAYATMGCARSFRENGWLSCGRGGNSFRMHNLSLRFDKLFAGGFVYATVDFWNMVENGGPKRKKDEGGDTPMIQIGKCTEI